jgi:hypothetical protein
MKKSAMKRYSITFTTTDKSFLIAVQTAAKAAGQTVAAYAMTALRTRMGLTETPKETTA